MRDLATQYMTGVGVLLALAIIGCILVGCIKRVQADWRLEQIRKDPEAYRLYRKWEARQDAQIKEGFDKSGQVAGKVAGGALKGAAFLAKMILKK
jgi:hypothetical protein